MRGNRKLADVTERFLRQSADNQRLWAETEHKRVLGIALASYRAERGLSQKDVAERAGWDKAFVSRLEGAQGGYPETATLERYVEACGARLVVGLMDLESFKGGRIRILDVMKGPAHDIIGDSARIESSDLEQFKTMDFGETFESES